MTSYRRAPTVLWRLADDRVLLRRVGDGAEEFDLSGAVALVWLALEAAVTVDELASELMAAGSEDAREQVVAAIEQLQECGLVFEAP